jgi:hypothetical protein
MAAATGKISAIVAGKGHRIWLVFRLPNYSIGFSANRQYPCVGLPESLRRVIIRRTDFVR